MKQGEKNQQIYRAGEYYITPETFLKSKVGIAAVEDKGISK